MFPSNHSGWEPHFLFHYQAKTHEIARMFVGFREKELSLYSRCCEKYIWAMGREKRVHKIMLMQYSYLIYFHAKERSVLPAKKYRTPVLCVKCFFQRALKVGLLPRGR